MPLVCCRRSWIAGWRCAGTKSHSSRVHTVVDHAHLTVGERGQVGATSSSSSSFPCSYRRSAPRW